MVDVALFSQRIHDAFQKTSLSHLHTIAGPQLSANLPSVELLGKIREVHFLYAAFLSQDNFSCHSRVSFEDLRAILAALKASLVASSKSAKLALFKTVPFPGIGGKGSHL